MKKFVAGDWVVRKAEHRDGHPYWRKHQDTPMQVCFVLSNGDISFYGEFGSWMGVFFDPSEPPPPVNLEDWL